MRASALARTISIRSSVDRKNGQSRYIARSFSPSPRSSACPSASSTPSHDASSKRVCVHANCHGIARRLSTPALFLSGRRDGRRADVEQRQFGFWRDLAEVFDEARMIEHDAAIRAAGDAGELLHARAFGGGGGTAHHQRRVERRGRVDLERAHGDVFEPELRLDHLALFGDADRAVHRSRRLRLDGDVGRPAAASHAAAAAVEQRDAHLRLAARRDNRLLRLIQLPRRAEAADVLRGVGVADHHFLMPANVRVIPRHRQQLPQHRSRIAQVVGGFDERHDAQRTLDARFTLQQFDGEHVRRVRRHGDDVGAERIAGQARDHLEGVEHVLHFR